MVKTFVLRKILKIQKQIFLPIPHFIAFGTRLFVKKIKHNAKSIFYTKLQYSLKFLGWGSLTNHNFEIS